MCLEMLVGIDIFYVSPISYQVQNIEVAWKLLLAVTKLYVIVYELWVDKS